MPTPTGTEVFDPEFKYVMEVPNSVVRHTPPSRLNITRLVFCRNYRPFEPSSCTMGSNCKFVHADIDPETLPSHPIHVNYVWRHESLCTYERLPAGDTLSVLAPNNRLPCTSLPSEHILLTRGSLRHRQHGTGAVFSHCLHFLQHRMCNRGEQCNFIHSIHVDPTAVEDFKRVPKEQQRGSSRHRSAHAWSTVTPVSTDVSNVSPRVHACQSDSVVPQDHVCHASSSSSSNHALSRHSSDRVVHDVAKATANDNVSLSGVPPGNPVRLGIETSEGQKPGARATQPQHIGLPPSEVASPAHVWFSHFPYKRRTSL